MNVPIADGTRAFRPRPPLFDALTVLVAARQAALATNALAGRVCRGEAAATDSRGARNNAAVRTCTSLSKLRGAGWGDIPIVVMTLPLLLSAVSVEFFASGSVTGFMKTCCTIIPCQGSAFGCGT